MKLLLTAFFLGGLEILCWKRKPIYIDYLNDFKTDIKIYMKSSKFVIFKNSFKKT